MSGKFDVHSHCGPWNSVPGRRWGADDLVELLGEAGIERSVVSSVRGLRVDLVSGNRETQEAVEKHEMLYGYIYVDPHRLEESAAEVERLAGHAKFIGVKSRDEYHGAAYNDARYRRLFGAIREFGLPALLHTFSVGSMEAGMELAAGYGAPVIMTHMGGFGWRGCEALREREIPSNVYVDPVSSASAPGKYELAREVFGEERLVFGTDCTLFHPCLAIGAIESSGLSEEAKRKLYWENPRRVFFPEER